MYQITINQEELEALQAVIGVAEISMKGQSHQSKICHSFIQRISGDIDKSKTSRVVIYKARAALKGGQHE